MVYSDDDMLDVHDDYDCDYDDYNDDSNGEEEDTNYGYVEEVGDISSKAQLNYVVLKEDEIRKRQKDDIEEVSSVLSITEVEASVLLLRNHWIVSKVHDEWFADEEKVRRSIGTWKKSVFKGRNFTCGICFESCSKAELVPVSCGHRYCVACWTNYIKIAINDGPGCLMLKCPEPSCPATFGRDMVDNLCRKKYKKKYYRYFLRSYIEDSRKMKWCPAPGCDHAIGFSAGDGRSYDVSCLCLNTFCWNCREDAHSPVDCDTVGKWILKNSAESENVTWLLANAKPCPKCKRQIEKNHGCMHMSCTAPCKHEFCWLCLGPWSNHKSGDPYKCNKYEAAKREGKYNEAERKREMAKNSLQRYTHYFERWASNEKSRAKGIEDLAKAQTVNLKQLSEAQATSETHLQFILDAWTQIIECRRVLKWTYAYGYYVLEHDQSKKEFFEYTQGEAESGLERLHRCVETELEPFQIAKGPSDDFHRFRTRLVSLTSITKTYFENLVKALENGLVDVASQPESSKRFKKGKERPESSKRFKKAPKGDHQTTII